MPCVTYHSVRILSLLLSLGIFTFLSSSVSILRVQIARCGQTTSPRTPLTEAEALVTAPSRQIQLCTLPWKRATTRNTTARTPTRVPMSCNILMLAITHHTRPSITTASMPLQAPLLTTILLASIHSRLKGRRLDFSMCELKAIDYCPQREYSRPILTPRRQIICRATSWLKLIAKLQLL